MGLWDHWVPGANKAMTEICEAWATKEKVDLKIDYLSTQGNKLYLTIAAEALARSGHDIMDFSAWEPNQYEASLEPVDDVMTEVLSRNGPVGPEYEYLAKPKGKWLGVPGIRGTLFLTACSRFDLMKEHAGIDLLAMFPAGDSPPRRRRSGLGMPSSSRPRNATRRAIAFGLPLGVTTDSVEWLGAFFRAFGAELVDAKGDITVKSDPVRQALEYLHKLTQFLPPDVGAWDNASNNKALVAGKTAFIFNPPSAWAVAKRDAPQVAEKLWTHGMPKGPKGRFVSVLPRFQGSGISPRTSPRPRACCCTSRAAKSAEKLVAACDGYDLPPYTKFNDFKTWEEVGPPKGTLSHYPTKGDQVPIIPCAPAPPSVASQIYTQAIVPKMVLRMSKGEPMETTLAWAASEVEGFFRN